jgi:molybdopterin-guanine dinucleotide biosynthesis protein MobB
VGWRKSGKTTVVESMVRELTKRGHHVATAKHISQKSFSMDMRGKDTWRHAVAGANPVAGVSDIEMSLLMKNGMGKFSLDSLLSFTPMADVVVLEGFSHIVLNDERVGKILCVRDTEEYEGFRKKALGKTIAFCSLQRLKHPILRIKEDSRILLKRVLTYISREKKISKILNCLPGLNCKKCGYPSCEEMAVAIYRRNAKLSDCVTLRLRSELRTRITIDKVEVPIQTFVSEIIHKSVLGMISSLKGVSVKGNERVYINISS